MTNNNHETSNNHGTDSSNIYERFEQPAKESKGAKWFYRAYTSIFAAGLLAGGATVAYNHLKPNSAEKENSAAAQQLKDTYEHQIQTGQDQHISNWTWNIAAQDTQPETFTALIVNDTDIAQAQTYTVDIINGQPQLTLAETCDILYNYVNSTLGSKGASKFSPIYEAVNKLDEPTADVTCQTVTGTPRLVVKKEKGSVIFDTQKGRSAGKYGM